MQTGVCSEKHEPVESIGSRGIRQELADRTGHHLSWTSSTIRPAAVVKGREVSFGLLSSDSL